MVGRRGNEMTEFTKEFIAAQRYVNNIIINHELTTRTEILLATEYNEALDEIERLQDLMLAYENDLVLLSVYGKLKRAEERIEELEQERRWIPVSESKPELDKNSNEDGTINVLVYIKNYKRILEATYYPKMAVWNMPYGWGDETDNITHWMIAIPHPPKEEE
jgi:hypothetical protein